MSDAVRQIEARAGAITVRRQTPADAPFLYGLFRANAMRILEQTGLPLASLDQLVEMQHRSRMQTYGTLFPSAVWSIVERDGEPVGEIIEHDEQDCIYVVDIALLPQHQAQGIGPALMRAVMTDSATRGQGVRAKVIINNEPSLKMFGRLGFQASPPDEISYIEWRWRPSPASVSD